MQRDGVVGRLDTEEQVLGHPRHARGGADLRCVIVEVPDHGVVEGRDDHVGASFLVEELGEVPARAQVGVDVVVGALDLDDHRSLGEGLEGLGDRGDPEVLGLVAGHLHVAVPCAAQRILVLRQVGDGAAAGDEPVRRVQLLDLVEDHVLDLAGAVGRAVDGRVVDDHEFAVGGGVHVEFDEVRADVGGPLVGVERVQGCLGPASGVRDVQHPLLQPGLVRGGRTDTGLAVGRTGNEEDKNRGQDQWSAHGGLLRSVRKRWGTGSLGDRKPCRRRSGVQVNGGGEPEGGECPDGYGGGSSLEG
ncbi:hypothetical protein GCM10028793_27000 [Nocardiopsis oceani]